MNSEVKNLLKRTGYAAVASSVLSGCGTIFDYSPVAHTKDYYPKDLATVAREAGHFEQKYIERAAWLANSAQFFDVPVITAAIAGVTGLAFGAHRDFGIIAGVVGGSTAAYGVYYAPRPRSDVYLDGAAATRCISVLARRLAESEPDEFGFTGTGLDNLRSNLAGPQPTMTQLMIARLSSAVEEAKFKLSAAIDQISSVIFARGKAASRAPDAGKIADNLTNAVRSDQQREQQLLAALAANDVPPRIVSRILSSELTIELETEITTCVSKAGSL